MVNVLLAQIHFGLLMDHVYAIIYKISGNLIILVYNVIQYMLFVNNAFKICLVATILVVLNVLLDIIL